MNYVYAVSWNYVVCAMSISNLGPLEYKGIRLDHGYQIDLIVERAVIVELKSVKALAPVHEAQLITYLKLTGIRVGLLINFNVVVLKEGLKRLVV